MTLLLSTTGKVIFTIRNNTNVETTHALVDGLMKLTHKTRKSRKKQASDEDIKTDREQDLTKTN